MNISVIIYLFVFFVYICKQLYLFLFFLNKLLLFDLVTIILVTRPWLWTAWPLGGSSRLWLLLLCFFVSSLARLLSVLSWFTAVTSVGFVGIYLMKIEMISLVEGLEDPVFMCLLSFCFILLNYIEIPWFSPMLGL